MKSPRDSSGAIGSSFSPRSAEPGQRPAYYLIVGLYADSREQMESILQTRQGQACIADVANFATGGATFLYNDEEVLIPYSL